MRTSFFLAIFALLVSGGGVSANAATLPSTANSAGVTAVAPAPSPAEAPDPEGTGVAICLVDIPAATQTDPRAQSYIVDRLPPGAEIQRRIEVTNTSSSSRTVRIYTGSAQIQDGAFVGGADPAVNELTTWTTLDKAEVQLDAGEMAYVLVTVAVPADASEGEQYALVWAEVHNDVVADSAVIRASRVGVRMYLSVGPGNGAAADFAVDAVTASRDGRGNPTVAAQVTNTGGRALDLSGDLMMAGGPAGLSAGPFSVQHPLTIAPGDTDDVVITLDAELPNGPWDATLALKSGLVEREASATITFPDAGVGETVTPKTGLPVLWIAIGSAAVLLVLAAGVFVILRRRRLRSARGAAPAEPNQMITG